MKKKIDISKDEFCRVIQQLQQADEKQIKINDALGAIVDTGDLSEVVINLLNRMMDCDVNDIYGSDIDYFCWELDFGKRWTPDTIQDAEGNSIDISTAEKLYDYLISD